MKRFSWQLVLCAFIFSGWIDFALAQKVDFAAVARQVTSGANVDEAIAMVPPSRRQKRKGEVLNMLSEAEKPGFEAAEPDDSPSAMQYYDRVQKIKRGR